MARIVNGTVTVPEFASTGNLGEYQITGATFQNQADTAGNGAYDIQLDYVIYVPATDPNTFFPIPGVVHRYRITSVTVIDQATVDMIVTWDEPGDEFDIPTNGIDCLISQTSSNKKYGFPVEPSLYPTLPAYVSSAAINNDIENITDKTEVSSGSTPTHLHVQAVDSLEWVVTHNKGSANYVYTIFDDTGDQCLPNDVETVNGNTIKLHFLAAMRGKAMFMFV